ncbi:AraC family transcriptional regulator [Burkholderia pseudomallei]|nr:AraC family transcriptional regulator [Burkholderia pseudomallei]CAJ9764900.1 AraC family transcriptional regulator [Burkholderia pseudomallei]CAJ9825475.1 AraC family transcriptional regulator [Burkholderia pseudomallei]
MSPSRFRRYQALNDASREASEAAALRGAGIAGAPAIVPAARARGEARAPAEVLLPG